MLTGHSHSYERSFLIDGHYGLVDAPGTRRRMRSTAATGATTAGGDGAYTKPAGGPAPHEGAVYVVAGSSGQITGGALNHPGDVHVAQRRSARWCSTSTAIASTRRSSTRRRCSDEFTIIKSTQPCSLDVDASSSAQPLNDGLLVLRYLFGFTGPTLVSGVLSSGATRTDPAAIAAYLDGLRS